MADIELMGKVVTSKTGIKASGGVQTVADAIKLYEASQKYRAHEFRVGASKLVNEYRQ